MKIGFLIADMESGGAQRATAALADYFALCGNEVTVLTVQKTPVFYSLSEGVICRPMQLRPLGRSKAARAVGVIRRVFEMRREIGREKFCCLIGMSNIMTAYAVVTTALTKTKAIGTERTNPFACGSKLLSVMRRLFSRLADGYVFQTKGARSFFPKSVHKKTKVIPNAVFCNAALDGDRARKREKSICTMCRLSPEKGVDTLIRAFALVKKQLPDTVLKVYGEGMQLENLVSLASDKKVAESVSFEGAVPDAISKIRNAGVFVLSSRVEGMPNSLIEALACGIPCVSTRCKLGPEELIEDGVNGLLVPVDDERMMAKAIIRILKNSDYANRLSREAVAVSSRLSIEKIGNKWLEYLGEVTGDA